MNSLGQLAPGLAAPRTSLAITQHVLPPFRTPASLRRQGQLFQSTTIGNLPPPRQSRAHRLQTQAFSAGQALVELAENFPLRDALAVGLSVVGAKFLVSFFETLEEKKIMDKKVSRKMVHTLAGPLFLLCWPLFSASPYSQFFAALVPTLNMARLVLAGTETVKDPRAVAAMTRTGDPSELLRGPLYYVIVLQLVTAVYWRSSPVGVVIVSLMCGGDGLADIVGRRWGGSNRLPWNPEKSWAGSGAMFFGGLGAAACLLWYFAALGYLQLDGSATAAAVTAIAAVATLIESLPINKTLDDNVSVPGVAALMGVALLQIVETL